MTGRPENQKVETVKELLFVVFDVVWFVLALACPSGCFTIAVLEVTAVDNSILRLYSVSTSKCPGRWKSHTSPGPAKPTGVI